MSQSPNQDRPNQDLPNQDQIWRLGHVHKSESLRIGECEKALECVLNRPDVGFTRFNSRPTLLQAIELRAREVSRLSTQMVVIGMGGSSLGGRAMLAAVPRPRGRGNIAFFDNVDSEKFWAWLRAQNDLGSIHWVLVSKSGNTIETLAMADFVDQHLRQSGHRRLSTVSTVVSELKESPLTNWARKESVPVLEIPSDIGGRFSVLTSVGLLPAAFAGLRLEKIFEGATWALGDRRIVAEAAALSLDSFSRQKWVTMLWSYCDGLKDFGGWWQQLWAESLAKKFSLNGDPGPRVSTPVSAIGACDQHSLLQQVIEGSPDKFVWFQRVMESENTGPRLERTLFEGQEMLVGKTLGDLLHAEAEATERAMHESGIKTARLVTERLDERSIAGLFMFWQLVVATMGEVLQINAYNQPGVEQGKIIARSLLR
jgi:glucose-6-phosphate isomerase